MTQPQCSSEPPPQDRPSDEEIFQPFEPSRLLVTSQLRFAGQDPRDVRDDDGDHRYAVVRHGVMMLRAEWDRLAPGERHAAFVHGTALMARGAGHTFSHWSAAALWCMPVATPWPRQVHVIVPPGKGRSSSLVVRHEMSGEPTTGLAGVALTTPARTIVDVARFSEQGLLDGLMAADYALRAGLCTRDDIEGEWKGLGAQTHGRHIVEQVIELADARAESAGESLSRGQLYIHRYPRPLLQEPQYVNGRWVATVDFDWGWLVGEFDGKFKYGRQFAETVEQAEERLWREKSREDLVRRRKKVARWGWDDALFAKGMCQALEAQGLRPEPRRTWFTPTTGRMCPAARDRST